MRQPLMGYNHNLLYKSRVYHVQTEDSGAKNARVFSHLFFKGTIVCSARTDYANRIAEPQLEPALVKLMREQHKSLMRRLHRGDLDAKIISTLGSLEPKEDEPEQEYTAKLRSYRHQICHADRKYAIQTDYYSKIRTDVYFETILIASQTEDCRGRATPGGDVVTKLAQTQHKALIRQLRDGSFDDKIRAFLGTLSPNEQAPRELTRGSGKAPIERYQHQFRYGTRVLDVRTQVYVSRRARLLTQLFHRQTLLTSRDVERDLDNRGAEAIAAIRREAQDQHKEMLRQLRRGDLDDTLMLLDELEEVDTSGPEPGTEAPEPADELQQAGPSRQAANE